MPKTKTFRFNKIYIDDKWKNDFYITIDNSGQIISFDKSEVFVEIEGLTLPGFQNTHSHSFQYAMAGLAEHLGQNASQDDFWIWRNNMYKLALALTPEQFQAIAAMLYCQMIQHGITQVVEFHYLHHDKNGSPFANQAEMSLRLFEAAKMAGINITLVPIFYQKGGFNKAAEPSQTRFLSKNLDSYLSLWDLVHIASKDYASAKLGYGIHSLRAVEPDTIKEMLSQIEEIPFHIHIAEQQKEVDDCKAALGAEPIDWLLENCDVNKNYHLVHATHMQQATCDNLADSGATVVICPSTEGNLGDGFFRLKQFRQSGGKISIGTDSNIALSPFEDIRWLDYGQRLLSQKRNVLCDSPGQDSGSSIFKEVWHAGRNAAGYEKSAYFSIGRSLDAVIIDEESPTLIQKPDDHLLSSIIYSGDQSMIKSTIVSGKTTYTNKSQTNYSQILSGYKKAMSEVYK